MKIIEHFPAEKYHATDALSASRLKQMARSPAHCRWSIDHPETSPAMEFGTLFHAVCLEPDQADAAYAIVPDCDRRTLAGKAAFKIFSDSLRGRKAVAAEDWDLAHAMSLACQDHPAFGNLFGCTGRNELSVFWDDEESGQACKLRADRIVEVPGFGLVCADLKTTTDASPRAFAWSALRKFGYDLQAAWYMHGLQEAEIYIDAFVFMAVEKTPPYAVGVYAMERDCSERVLASDRCIELARRYDECVKTNHWPAYSEQIMPLRLPGFNEEF